MARINNTNENNKNLITDNNFINVYIRELGFECDDNPILKERQEDIDNTTGIHNKIDKRDKYYAWKLLEEACRHALGKELNDLNPHKLKTGKWVIDDYYISISHSGGYAMVCISNKPIGVDLQRNREMSAVKATEEMLPEELEYYGKDALEKHLIAHTKKEAIFKCYGNGPYKNINTLLYNDEVLTSSFHGMRMIYTICSDLIKENVNLNLYFEGKKTSIEDLKEELYYYG